MTDQLLSTRRAAAHLGRSYQWFRTLVRQGRGPTPAVHGNRGASHFFEIAELDRWGALHGRNECLPPVLPSPRRALTRSRDVIENTIVECDAVAETTDDPMERAEAQGMASALRWALGERTSLGAVWRSEPASGDECEVCGDEGCPVCGKPTASMLAE